MYHFCVSAFVCSAVQFSAVQFSAHLADPPQAQDIAEKAVPVAAATGRREAAFPFPFIFSIFCSFLFSISFLY